ncbi:MAG: DNA alkylation repair protein, partial [Alphaproteobacteria bacterium]|nr:DNA alkylation repair protein [Alphaproteobacteria bacterium]
EYLAKIFQHIKTQTYTGYYDKMAVAWLISIAYIKFLKETEAFLLNTPLDEFIFRKSISKICDSFRIKKETKVRLKTLASVRKTNKA